MQHKQGPETEAHQLSRQCLRLAVVSLQQARSAGYIADYKPHDLDLYDQLISNLQQMAEHLDQLKP